jgi:hypothetical protein
MLLIICLYFCDSDQLSGTLGASQTIPTRKRVVVNGPIE